jgi:hypothetical protein
MDYTIGNYSDLRKNKDLHNELNYYVHQSTGLQLGSSPFDLLYANIKARANRSMPRPPSDPQRVPATHRLDVVIIYGKNFPVDFIFDNERFPVNFVLIIAAKDDQFSINGGSGDRIDHRSSHWILHLP